MKSPKIRSAVDFVAQVYKRYVAHRVSRRAAEVTYYMLFTLFPFVIFVYSVLSFLDQPIDEILDKLIPVLPANVYELIMEYLTYVGGMSRTFMLYAGSVLAVYMLYKAITSLNYSVRKASDSPNLKSRNRIIMSLLVSCVMMFAIFALLILFSISRNIYHYIALFFELDAWVNLLVNIIRYAVGPVFMFFALSVYYYIMDDRKVPFKRYMPGAGFAIFLWYAFSVAFMIYANYFGKYTNLYGSLASIMVLMIWFHTTAASFILGAEINTVLNKNE